MTSTEDRARGTGGQRGSGARRGGGGRTAVHEAALRLFAEHGVSGTSLQMIADSMGVTKAAVYHHYRTKDEIVLGILAPALDRLTAVVGEAEARDGHAAQAEAVVTGLVEALLADRWAYGMLQGDPAVATLLRQHPPLQALVQRIRDLLTGPDPDATTRIAVAALGNALRGTATDPLCADLDDETMRVHLVGIARRVLAGCQAHLPPA
ncbi:helix-turn-helix domain-containing protein [Modestobacter sp. NPDC049651]|uniref:TetR/AcrR family transcriptional regulator n=1 Tax=unclassified Modestobacter TaxID=2643866 RepID=UPI0033E32BB2